jgi:hypothetical protein
MARNIGLKIPYEPVWERIKSKTGWERHLELADFLDITSATVSHAWKKGSFPIQWAFKVAQVYDCSTDWLLTGADDDEVKTEDRNEKPVMSSPRTAAATEPKKENVTVSSLPSDTLGLGESVELLAKIYNSGNTVLVRAINANLHAFSEAVDNKALAQRAIDMMDEMNRRVLTLENKLANLEKENEDLKRKPPGDSHQANG